MIEEVLAEIYQNFSESREKWGFGEWAT
jgi:hypothetical protein